MQENAVYKQITTSQHRTATTTGDVDNKTMTCCFTVNWVLPLLVIHPRPWRIFEMKIASDVCLYSSFLPVISARNYFVHTSGAERFENVRTRLCQTHGTDSQWHCGKNLN